MQLICVSAYCCSTCKSHEICDSVVLLTHHVFHLCTCWVSRKPHLHLSPGKCSFQVLKELEALSASYPFQVPSYFALILRAFSVIEGIALRVSTLTAGILWWLAHRLLQMYKGKSSRRW